MIPHTLEQVTEKFCDIAGDFTGRIVVPADNLLYDLNMDSLDLLEFVVSLEEEFIEEFPDDELEKLDLNTLTVGEAAKAFYKQFSTRRS